MIRTAPANDSLYSPSLCVCIPLCMTKKNTHAIRNAITNRKLTVDRHTHTHTHTVYCLRIFLFLDGVNGWRNTDFASHSHNSYTSQSHFGRFYTCCIDRYKHMRSIHWRLTQRLNRCVLCTASNFAEFKLV